MKKTVTYLVLGLTMLLTAAFLKTETKNPNPANKTDHYISLLDGTKAYTLELAEAMPADKYTFRPTDSVRSFGEQLAHIAISTQFLLDVFVDGKPMPGPEDFAKSATMEKEMGVSKEACINSLNESFDAVVTKLESMDAESLQETFTVPFDPANPEFTKEKAFDFITDHLIHHRAQALVALRMQHIKAPPFRLY